MSALVWVPVGAAQVVPNAEQVRPSTALEDTPDAVLIRGARIFKGCSPDLLAGQDVFVTGHMIVRIGADLDPPDFATRMATST